MPSYERRERADLEGLIGRYDMCMVNIIIIIVSYLCLNARANQTSPSSSTQFIQYLITIKTIP
jgi:hypothetical protein